jgi:large subunit ribosomal protein L12
MEYVYAALLLHKLKQDINEDNIKNVIKATGAAPDDVRVKSLVAAISEVNIEDALKAAPIAAAPSAAAAAAPASSNAGAAAADKEEEKKEEKKEEEALEGLSSLFG